MENEKSIEIYAARQEGYCLKNDQIQDSLFDEFGVNRGLRDIRGVGVLTGLTNISKVNGAKVVDGIKVPMEGELWYRGYRIEHLVEDIKNETLDETKDEFVTTLDADALQRLLEIAADNLVQRTGK